MDDGYIFATYQRPSSVPVELSIHDRLRAPSRRVAKDSRDEGNTRRYPGLHCIIETGVPVTEAKGARCSCKRRHHLLALVVELVGVVCV